MTKILERLKQFEPRAYEQRMELAKALDTKTEAPRLFHTGGVKANTIDEETGTLIAKVSTPGVDRYGDIMVPHGMDNGNFRRNPVVLFGHDDTKPPIGKSMMEEAADEGVYSEAKFDLADPFASSVFRKYVEGFMSAFSIRFLPKRYDKVMAKNEETGQETWTGGFVFHEWELLEFSAVPIPANAECVALSLSGAASMARALGLDVGETTPPPHGGTIDPTVEALARTLSKNLSADLADQFAAAILKLTASQKPPDESKAAGAAAIHLAPATRSPDVAELLAVETAYLEVGEFLRGLKSGANTRAL